MSSWSFPILKSKEIHQCLSELQVPVTLEELQSPTPEVTRMLFETFVELLLGLTPADFAQPQLFATDVFSFPELHSESVAEAAFQRNLLRIMRTAGMPRFNMTAVTEPDSKTLRTALSALINFTKFREERLIKYQELNAETEAYMESKADLEEENRNLCAELGEFQKRRAKEAPTVEQLEKEARALESQIHSLNQDQAVLTAEAHRQRDELHAINDTLNSRKIEIQEFAQKNTKLKSQIVPSPAQVRKDIEDLDNSVCLEKKHLSQKEKRYQEIQILLDSAENTRKDIMQALDIVRDAETEMQKATRASDSLREKKNAEMRQKSLKDELLLDIEANQKKKMNLEARIQKLEEQYAPKFDALEKKKQSVLREISNEKSHRSAMQNKISSNINKIESIQDEMKVMRDRHDEELQHLLDSFDMLRHQVRDGYEDLFSSLHAR